MLPLRQMFAYTNFVIQEKKKYCAWMCMKKFNKSAPELSATIDSSRSLHPMIQRSHV
jgi:hypothetical protein